MEATIAVSLTIKINAEGDTPDELIENAVLRTIEIADEKFGATWSDGVPGISVEGAAALVNRNALAGLWS